jgi:hypothetical protein
MLTSRKAQTDRVFRGKRTGQEHFWFQVRRPRVGRSEPVLWRAHSASRRAGVFCPCCQFDFARGMQCSLETSVQSDILLDVELCVVYNAHLTSRLGSVWQKDGKQDTEYRRRDIRLSGRQEAGCQDPRNQGARTKHDGQIRGSMPWWLWVNLQNKANSCEPKLT